MANEADTSLETTALETSTSTPLESSLDTVADPAALETALDAGETVSELGFIDIAINFMLDGGSFMFIILFFLFFGGTAMIRGNLVCKYCKQREIGCPAEKLFNKE